MLVFYLGLVAVLEKLRLRRVVGIAKKMIVKKGNGNQKIKRI